MKPIIQSLCTLFFIFLLHTSQAQVTFKIAGLPDDTPLEDRIFLAGNFNNWNPGDSSLSIDWKDLQQRTITIYPEHPGQLEFKFTRGNWPSAEGNGEGNYLPNRILDYKGIPLSIEITIQSWEDFEQSNAESTAAPNVYLLDDNFYMPQLDRNRRILIYLPYSYFGSDKHYPVMYMHDCQNLFDATTSFSGEWGVDETLNQLIENGFPEMIVVGIDNGGGERINELTPYPNAQYGGGQGDEYIRFIIETLKPHVDQQYRTLTEAKHTGIMGSSLGGLISMYAASTYPEVFGKAGVLSPSFWWSDEIYRTASQISSNSEIYLLGSQVESETMRAHLEGMYNTLRSAGVPADNIHLNVTSDGAHSEWYWARELPNVLRWLYRPKATGPWTLNFNPLVISSNRNNSRFRLQGRSYPEGLKIKITGQEGQLLDSSAKIKGNKIKLSNLPEDARFINLYEGDRLVNCIRVN